MSSEEELDDLEMTVQTTMYRYMILRSLRVLSTSLLLLLIELAVLILAVIGVFHLHGWTIAAGAGLWLAVLAVRAWRWRTNVRRRPAEPSRRSGVFVKLASLPWNALGFPAFAAWMPFPAAVATCSALLVVELLLWLTIRGPAGDDLKRVAEFMKDTHPPRTWEV